MATGMQQFVLNSNPARLCAAKTLGASGARADVSVVACGMAGWFSRFQ